MKKLLSLALGLACFVSACAAAGPPPPIYRNDFTTNLNPVARNVVTQIVSSLTSTGGISLVQATNVAIDVANQRLILSNALYVARLNGFATNLTVLGPDGGTFLTLSNGTFSPIVIYGSGDNEGFVANNYVLGDSLGGNSYALSFEVSTNESRWLNAGQQPIFTLRQNKTVIVHTNLTLPYQSTNSFLYLSPGGIVRTGIIGNNLTFDASNGRLDATAGGEVTEVQYAAVSNRVVNAETTNAAQTVSIAAKQHGSFILTNLIAMGITNIAATDGSIVITTNAGVLRIASTGSGTPDGDSGAIQFNQGDTFAGTNDFIWNRTNKTLVVRNQDLTGSKYIYFAGSSLTAPDFSIQAGTNEFILQPDFGSSGTYLRANKSGKWISIGSTANNLGTNWGDWYFPSNVAMGTASITGTGSPQHTFGGGSTNYSTKLADSTVTVTNLVGLRHVSAATPLAVDANVSHNWSVTNRISAATTLVVTNTADGQDIQIRLLGEISGGTSRVITIIPELGHLVVNSDVFGTALATSMTFTLTNGNMAEIWAACRKLNGTNTLDIVTRQKAF